MAKVAIADLLQRYLPSAQFNQAMEEFLDKGNPDRVVAWPVEPMPEWARGFRPRIFLDLGSGLGGVTAATLIRLAQWGCLAQLEKVVLVDRDAMLHHEGARGLQGFLKQRIADTLRRIGCPGVEVQVHIREIMIEPAGQGMSIPLLDQICPFADLILASHVTYYFGDGSGRELVEALGRRYLGPQGLIWVNIRDLDCPAYAMRRDILIKLGISDLQPLDYAEFFPIDDLGRTAGLRLVGRSRIEGDVRHRQHRSRVAGLIMWRAEFDPSEALSLPLREAATALAESDGPLYSETQFILAAR